MKLNSDRYEKTYPRLLFVSTILFSFAGNSDLFTYNGDELLTEFLDLQTLETMVIASQNLTIADFEQIDVDWLNRIDFENMKTTSPIQAAFDIDDMEWGAFAWGFCCSPIGFFTVAISDDKSNNEKLSYWIGVVVSSILGSISAIASPNSYNYNYSGY